jgi:Protein phosphatase 2C
MEGVHVGVFHTQKAGNAVSEYEDAFWPKQTAALREETMRVAVADGATDAVYSGLWARLLVKAYGKHLMTGETIRADLMKASEVWNRVVGRSPLPWYAEEKARAGAYAALVGLELNRQGDGLSGNWSVLACGDSCFFHLRSDRLIRSFPLSRAEEFSSSPLLFGSNPETRGLEALRITAGSWEDGDCFYLMSDALASWSLSSHESGENPWQRLREITLSKGAPFEDWISSLRRDRAIKNDDCTLIGIVPSILDE